MGCSAAATAIPEGKFGGTCLNLEIDISLLLSLIAQFPGGAQLSAQITPGTIPDLGDIVAQLMGQLNSALLPLVPIFRLIDVALLLFECIKAIPDALGPPPNPTNLIKCLSKLAKAISKLLALVPQLSVPILASGICRILVAALKAVRAELACIATFKAGLDAGFLVATALELNPDTSAGALDLTGNLNCAQANLDLQFELLGSGMGPINALIKLVNLFLALVGINELGGIGLGGSAASALGPLDDAIETLDAFCKALPI